MKLNCGHDASAWLEEPPTSNHAYRVECARCGKFEKWGAEGELISLRAAGADVAVVPYKETDEGPTLDEFFE